MTSGAGTGNACGRAHPTWHPLVPSADRYRTPAWMVDVLLDHWISTAGLPLLDPACGPSPTIGERVRERHAIKDFWQMDTAEDYAHPDVFSGDYLETVCPGPQNIATNPPYGDLLEPYLRKALRDCAGYTGGALEERWDVALLVPYLWLTAVEGERSNGLRLVIQPRRRVMFELEERDALLRVAWNACLASASLLGTAGALKLWEEYGRGLALSHTPGTSEEYLREVEEVQRAEREAGRKVSPVAVQRHEGSSTGWVVGSPGGAHVWAVWHPGYSGSTELRIVEVERAGREGDCRG